MLRKIAWLMLACIAIAIVGGCKGAETTNGGGDQNGMKNEKPETPNGGDSSTEPGTGDTGSSTTTPGGEEGAKTPTEGGAPSATPTEGGN